MYEHVLRSEAAVVKVSVSAGVCLDYLIHHLMTDDNQTLLEDADRDPDLTLGLAWSLAQTCVQVLVADCSI